MTTTTTTTTTSHLSSVAAAVPRPVERTRRIDVTTVADALRSEWIKLSTIRSTAAIVGLTALLGALIAWALAATSDAAPSASELFIYPLPLVAMLATVAGILMFTSEAQHGTLAVMLAARPSRWVIVAAKAATAVMVGLALGALGMLGGYAGAVLGGAAAGNVSDIMSRASWALLYIALAAVIGLGVGMIVRHSAGAISGLLMWSFVVESLFSPALPDGVLHFLPFSAGYRLLDAGPGFETPVVIADELARTQYALIFGAYALVGLAVGTLLLYRRDSN